MVTVLYNNDVDISSYYINCVLCYLCVQDALVQLGQNVSTGAYVVPPVFNWYSFPRSLLALFPVLLLHMLTSNFLLSLTHSFTHPLSLSLVFALSLYYNAQVSALYSVAAVLLHPPL